jgi:hypothetical protein
MSEPTESELTQASEETAAEAVVSETEARAKRVLIISLVAVGLLLIGMIALLIVLSINAYNATMLGVGPDPGAVVVSLLRDAAIILVAFETLIIGVLLVVLTLQVQALVMLLRDEIRPMLEALNDTVSTVRGTAQFMSHNVVTPSIRAAGFLAGVRRVAAGVADLVKPPDRPTDGS